MKHADFSPHIDKKTPLGSLYFPQYNENWDSVSISLLWGSDNKAWVVCCACDGLFLLLSLLLHACKDGLLWVDRLGAETWSTQVHRQITMPGAACTNAHVPGEHSLMCIVCVVSCNATGEISFALLERSRVLAWTMFLPKKFSVAVTWSPFSYPEAWCDHQSDST